MYKNVLERKIGLIYFWILKLFIERLEAPTVIIHSVTKEKMVQEIARQVAPNVFSIEKRLPLQNLRFNTTPHGALIFTGLVTL